MRITIWDMDWFYKKSFIPNYKAQKISSFHKQKEDIVYLALNEDHLKIDYDIMYIIRDSPRSPMPDIKYIDNKSVRLVGYEFKFYDNNYTIPVAVDMVRPDYQLYPIDLSNKYYDANVLQLFSGTRYLNLRQNHTNYSIRSSQKTLVVDELFWAADDKNIIKALKELKNYKNIVFLHRISIKRIIYNKSIAKLFLELDLASYDQMRFRNDTVNTFEAAKEIIDFYVLLKKTKGNLIISPLPIRGVTLDHWNNPDSYFDDLKRCLITVDYAKKHGINIVIKTALKKHDTPYWFIFDRLEAWTTYYLRTSYIESMLSSRSKRTGESWHDILSNRNKWSTPNSQFLATLIAKDYEFFAKYGTRQWKDQIIDFTIIKEEKIKKDVFGRLNEFQVIKTLEEEITE